MYDLKYYLNAINFTKKNLMNDEEGEMWKRKYNAYTINRILSGFKDTLMFANMMNQWWFLDKDMQFHFFINSVRSRKRFAPWIRPESLKDIEYVREYYGYNNDKAKLALDMLTKDELKTLKQKLYKGGTK
tara:strand:- start:141 stop:530 length:390 start_codon:yes stop_codon:yes gene_type:complete